MIKHANFLQNCFLQKGRHYFLACSGGVDSMVLLYLLQQSKLKITVLHVNYQLRGQASNDDQQFVIDYCHKRQITLETITVNTPELLKNGGNLQETARKIRYEWFQSFIDLSPDNYLILAHHLDDQVETFFQHISRKAGIMGLACMLPMHKQTLRPLLDYTKEEILDFATKKGISWREDASNSDSKYTRNKLRNILLPFLQTHIPTIQESVRILTETFQQTQLEVALEVQPTTEKILQSHALSFQKWDAFSEEKQTELLRQLSIRLTATLEINKLRNAPKGKKITIDNWIISVGKDGFHIEQLTNFTLPIIIHEKVDQLPTTYNKHEIYLDEDKLVGELAIRTWKTGDRIYPIGMQGSQLVSKILKEQNISIQDKENTVVLTNQDQIIWIYPYKISRKFIATATTKNILKVQLKQTV